MSDNSTRARCIHCFGFLSASSNSTLRAHVKHLYCEALKTVPEPRQQSMGRDRSVFVYNLDYLREQFAKRKQHASTLKNDLDFEDEVLDAEVQENEATPLSDEEIALDAASEGTMAFSSGEEEPDFDYDLTNYDD
nr:hypothetical protein [Tanacetum cinerariifolium]